MNYSRQEPRCAIECMATLLCYDFETSAVVKEMSHGDVRLVSSERLRPGMAVFLSIVLPCSDPLDIEVATVQWTHAEEAGLTFVIIGLESRERLASILSNRFSEERPMCDGERALPSN